jgi:5-methyltetrahydrofolate--homocysteine methyltransferase
METVLRGTGKPVVVSPERPFVIIGEKLNPTGRKKMAEALRQGDLATLEELATSQVRAGAQVLDINVGLPDIDAVRWMTDLVTRLGAIVPTPFCLDSPDPRVLAAGLAAAPGKALVNSVSGEEKRLGEVLPLVKEHGAAVIGLIMDDSGIPATPEARLKVAEKILERAVRMGIPQEDVIIDALAMAVSADPRAGWVTLEAVRLVHEKLGVNQSLGASNVSHGLPDRPVVNAAFLALAMRAGMTCAITDAAKLSPAIRATDLLLGRDEDGLGYIKNYRLQQRLLGESTPSSPGPFPH